MSHIHVQSLAEADSLADDLSSATRIALDCEAAGFHRYSDRLCLLQLTIGDRTWVVDPLTFDPTALLRPALERPEVAVVMHGADFDLRLLSRDLGIRIHGLIDTQIQASLIGEEGLGLASLLGARLGVKLSKKYQRADWANRPLTDGMLEYAADDTRYLETLTGMLAEDLETKGRTAWAEEECRALETVADDVSEPDEPEDPVLRVKGARDLPPRQVTALRAALEWRDAIARETDRALFRVVGDGPLVEAVLSGPRGVEDLPGRPPPELEVVVERLKTARNQAASRIGLPKGTLLANAVLLSIARADPKSVDELLQVDGMRRWKADVVGDRILEIMRAS